MPEPIDLTSSFDGMGPAEALNLSQRRELFRFSKHVIIGLYTAFVFVVVAFLSCPALQSAIIHHPHLLALPMALLLVPSFLLWGAVRAVYKVPQEQSEAANIVKAAVNHPINESF